MSSGSRCLARGKGASRPPTTRESRASRGIRGARRNGAGADSPGQGGGCRDGLPVRVRGQYVLGLWSCPWHVSVHVPDVVPDRGANSRTPRSVEAVTFGAKFTRRVYAPCVPVRSAVE